MKQILLVLDVQDEGFNEDEIIQNIISAIPNRITISMREVIQNA